MCYYKTLLEILKNSLRGFGGARNNIIANVLHSSILNKHNI